MVPTYAMFDSGASCSAISLDLVNKIGVDTKKLNIRLGTFDHETVAEREVASFSISDLHDSVELSVKNALVGTVLSTENETPPHPDQLVQYSHLKNLVFNQLSDPTVGLILDAKFAVYFLTGDYIVGGENEPISINTVFGQALIGPALEDKEAPAQGAKICILESDAISLTDEVSRLFRHDFIAEEGCVFSQEETHPSADDLKSLEIFEETLKFDPETGHYSVGLPWKSGREETAKKFQNIDFLTMAQNRLEKLRKKFLRNPGLKEQAFISMDRMIELGYASILSDLSAPEGAPVSYTPIHVDTRKPNKARICHDAAARVGSECLNANILSGPDFLNNLLKVLHRFRRKPVVLCGDIKDFFLQIGCHEMDAHAMRFFWWEDRTMQKVITLQGNRQLFGIISSPGISNWVIRKHAETIKELFPTALYEAILNALYCDDYLDSLDGVPEAIEMRKNLTQALKMGGFEMTKWRSNYPEVVADTLTPTSAEFFPRDPGHGRDAAAGENPSIGREFDVEEEVDDGTVDPAAEITTDSGNTQNLAHSGAGLVVDAQNDAAPTLNSSSHSPVESADEGESDVLNGQAAAETSADVIKKSHRGDEHFEDAVKQMLSAETGEKILGVGWDPVRDVMYVKIGDKHEKVVKTKTDMLSWIASVYDPLNILGPYILKGRDFFQRVNESGVGWKEDVPPDILTEFNKWKETITALKNVTIPRWTSCLGLEDSLTDLIICCDASKTGYGMVAYVKRHLKGGGVITNVSFLCAKSHVAPLGMLKKPVKNQEPHLDSIPRLELCACKLAAVQRDVLDRSTGETFDNYYMLTDSKTCLGWINNFEKRFRTFENFRIKSIRLLSDVSEWAYIPTKLNPADIASKGINANDYAKWHMFHNGPDFFHLDHSQWPTEPPTIPSTLQEEPTPAATEAAMAATAGSFQDPEHFGEEVNAFPLQLYAVNSSPDEAEIEVVRSEFRPWPLKVAEKKSSWSGKVRAIGLIRRAVMLLKERVAAKKSNLTETRLRPRKNEVTKKNFVILSQEEKEAAERLLVAAIQSQHFEKEILKLLKLGVATPNAMKELRSKNSRLTNLSPFLDKDNLIRAGGRIEKAKAYSYDMRNPMVLPDSKDENVRALIREHHVKNLHSSQQQTFSSLK